MSSIVTSDVSIPVEGQVFSVHVARPVEIPGHPAVVVLGAIWGVTPHIRDVCARLAREGFAAVAPDLYRGRGAPPEDTPASVLTDAFRAFPDERGVRDCRETVRRLATGQLGVPPGPVVAWGFCMGGRFAHYLGAVSERVAGVINAYGRLQFPRQEVKPFTPLDLAGLIQVPYLGIFAEWDDVVSPADIAALRERLAARRVPHDIKVYPGTHHGFFNDTRPEHHARASAEVWQRTLRFLREAAPPERRRQDRRNDERRSTERRRTDRRRAQASASPVGERRASRRRKSERRKGDRRRGDRRRR